MLLIIISAVSLPIQVTYKSTHNLTLNSIRQGLLDTHALTELKTHTISPPSLSLSLIRHEKKWNVQKR